MKVTRQQMIKELAENEYDTTPEWLRKEKLIEYFAKPLHHFTDEELLLHYQHEVDREGEL